MARTPERSGSSFSSRAVPCLVPISSRPKLSPLSQSSRLQKVKRLSASITGNPNAVLATVQLRGTGHETHAKNALEKNACARANLAQALQKRA